MQFFTYIFHIVWKILLKSLILNIAERSILLTRNPAGGSPLWFLDNGNSASWRPRRPRRVARFARCFAQNTSRSSPYSIHILVDGLGGRGGRSKWPITKAPMIRGYMQSFNHLGQTVWLPIGDRLHDRHKGSANLNRLIFYFGCENETFLIIARVVWS